MCVYARFIIQMRFNGPISAQCFIRFSDASGHGKERENLNTNRKRKSFVGDKICVMPTSLQHCLQVFYVEIWNVGLREKVPEQSHEKKEKMEGGNIQG